MNKTIYGQVVKHAEAQTDHETIRAELRAQMGKYSGTLLNEVMQRNLLRDISTSRQVVRRIIDIMLLIARQCLVIVQRLTTSQEAPYTLGDGNINHVHFLELVG